MGVCFKCTFVEMGKPVFRHWPVYDATSGKTINSMDPSFGMDNPSTPDSYHRIELHRQTA